MIKRTIDIDLMAILYYACGWHHKQIATCFGYKSNTTISDKFKELGLKSRDNVARNTGNKASTETRLKMGIAGKGKIISEKTRFKIGFAQLGSKNHAWQGGKITSQGYIMIKNRTHPNCCNNGYVKEHRLIMEKHLGRYLTKKEIIHHINGIRNDNRIENLQLMTQSEHTTLHNKLSYHIRHIK